MTGFIKLYRSSLDSAVFSNARTWQIWCWLLMQANWSHRQLLNGTVLNPGQMVISYDRLSRDIKCSKSTLFRVLRALQKCGNIELKPERSGTVVTIVNWDTYQQQEKAVGTQTERKRNVSETPAETEEEGKKERKKETKGVCFSWKDGELQFPSRLDDDTGQAAMQDWIQYQRDKGRPLPRLSAQLILERYAVSGSATLARDIGYSISQNWNGIFPPGKDVVEQQQAKQGPTKAEAWGQIRYRVMKCKRHDIEGGVCTGCMVPAEYIAKATSQLKAEGVIA